MYSRQISVVFGSLFSNCFVANQFKYLCIFCLFVSVRSFLVLIVCAVPWTPFRVDHQFAINFKFFPFQFTIYFVDFSFALSSSNTTTEAADVDSCTERAYVMEGVTHWFIIIIIIFFLKDTAPQQPSTMFCVHASCSTWIYLFLLNYLFIYLRSRCARARLPSLRVASKTKIHVVECVSLPTDTFHTCQELCSETEVAPAAAISVATPAPAAAVVAIVSSSAQQ